MKSLGHTITLGLCVVGKQALKKLQSHSFLPSVSMLLAFHISVDVGFLGCCGAQKRRMGVVGNILYFSLLLPILRFFS